MNKAILWLLIISALVSTAALGDDILKMDAAETLAITDKNGDDRIDRGEFQQRLTEVFFLIDTNKDGYLTLTEIEKVEKIDPRRFDAADKDDSRSLSLYEYLNALNDDFTTADTDNDGTLDLEELRHLIEKK